MNSMVKYALANLLETRGVTSAEHLRGDAIRITIQDQPDVVAVISASYTINAQSATQYHEEFPDMDFLCGYRKECIWEGGAIKYLEENNLGWGSAGTLYSAIDSGNVNTATHKDFFFSDRLIRHDRSITRVVREFDRIYSITLINGRTLRVGMIREYEPLADHVRTLWDKFGPVDIAWNINPHGNPTRKAIEAGQELGCKVIKWEELKLLLKKG